MKTDHETEQKEEEDEESDLLSSLFVVFLIGAAITVGCFAIAFLMPWLEFVSHYSAHLAHEATDAIWR